MANWFQKEADMCRPFIVNFYPKDNSVEIVSTVTRIYSFTSMCGLFQFDQKSRKMFLRRSPLDTCTLSHERTTPKQFYVGAKLNIFGRQFNITDYADDSTKITLSSQRES